MVRPNLHTLALGCIAVTMWYAGAAQQNGGAYILAFLTMAIAGVSLLQARANLRGLRIHAGLIPPTEAGTSARVPLTLTVGDGQIPCGIEVTGKGVASPVFIDKLSLEEPTRIELAITDDEHGKHDDLTLLVRSYYPLGIFTAQRAIKLTQTRLVLPKPEGTLPMPPLSESTGAGKRTSSKPAQAGEGDDFAGVREWQPGDSLRQVDWKAVARGRPMMVKLWSGASAGEVWFDWSKLDLPHGERTSQIAKWIDEAEALGADYGLRLPTLELEPANGAEHRRQCLEALATMATTTTRASTEARPLSITTRIASCETQPTLPGNPMRLLLITLGLVALPMITTLPSSASLIFFGSLLWRWWGLKKNALPLGMTKRLVIIGAGIVTTYLQTHALIGIEPGVAIMLVVTAGKVLETRTPRDMQVLAVLGWFLCLCNLALEQSIGRSLWTYATFFFIAVALVRLRRGAAGMKTPLRVTATLLMQAAPFAVLLFLFFPRGTFNTLVRAGRSLTNRTGMSDRLDPGSIASIARSSEIAFRVSLEGKSLSDIPLDARYWRCGVLWDCEGLSWKPSLHGAMPQKVPSISEGFVQRIQLLAHGGKWLPALDSPTRNRPGNSDHYLAQDDNTLRSYSNVNSMRTYEVVSHLEVPYERAKPGNLQPALLVPPVVTSQRVRELAESFKKQGNDPEKIVSNALRFYRDSGFQYSLEPGEYKGKAALEDFLFSRRLGFCEHYAASFATLMRIAGVPSRVIIGYQGGEYVQRSGYLLVRQSDAHAWTEVYLQGKGWKRVDPTAALAPQRLTTDMRTALESGAEFAFSFGRGSWLGQFTGDIELAWDQANYYWYDRVVQFDELKQDDLWQNFGLFRMGAVRTLLWGLTLFGVPLVGLSLWLSRKARHPDPAVRLWLKYCSRLAKQGLVREAGEGPLAFAERGSRILPTKAQDLQRAATAYAHYRYGGSVSLRELRALLG